MKLRDNIKVQLHSFEAAGAQWYMKPLTVKDVQRLQVEFSAMESNPDDLSPLMFLFTDVLVDEEGNQYEDIAAGMTFEELSEIIPVVALQEIADGVTKAISGQAQGN